MPSDNSAGLCCMAYHRNKAEILPLADVEVGIDSPNFQFLEDYWFWLWNWRESRSIDPPSLADFGFADPFCEATLLTLGCVLTGILFDPL